MEIKNFQPEHYLVKLSSATDDLEFSNEPYALVDLVSLENELAATKSKLDGYYDLAKKDKEFGRKYYNIQLILDTYYPLKKQIELSFGAQHVSNAWMKFYEIFVQYGLIPPNGEFKAFFNAELPGAGIFAFNHYMNTQRAGSYKWWASSLIPSEGVSALGDIYGLWASYRDHWIMGDKNDGNVTNIKNIKDFAAKIGPGSLIGGMDLASHDAGIDVSGDFNNQESQNAQIHLGCALAAFETLRIGGVFIAKQYTYFKSFTWTLILIYSTLFDEFYVCKPLTSRPTNSEIYLIGKGFRGMPTNIRNILYDRMVNFNMNPFLSERCIKKVFGIDVSQLIMFARKIYRQQITILEENMSLSKKYNFNPAKISEITKPTAKKYIDLWLKTYSVKTLPSSGRLNTK